MKKLMIALLALGAFGTSVFAGEMKKDGSVLLGYGIAGGDAGDTVDGGLAFGLEYEGYKINDTFSIGGAFMYTSGSKDLNLGFFGTIEYSVSTWGLLPYVKASKEVDMGGKKADLYGLAGLGFYSVTAEAGTASSSESEVGFNLGGGLMFPVGDKLKLGADLRYHLVASNLNYFIPSAKLTYSF